MLSSYEAEIEGTTISTYIMTNPHRELIYDYLVKQPKSYEGYYTLGEVIQRVEEGSLISWTLISEGKAVGMMLFEICDYGKGRNSININFLSCENFFLMMKMWDQLEVSAAAAGMDFIEAITPDVLANYAVKKKGFKSPSRYIVKAVNRGKEN